MRIFLNGFHLIYESVWWYRCPDVKQMGPHWTKIFIWNKNTCIHKSTWIFKVAFKIIMGSVECVRTHTAHLPFFVYKQINRTQKSPLIRSFFLDKLCEPQTIAVVRHRWLFIIKKTTFVGCHLSQAWKTYHMNYFSRWQFMHATEYMHVCLRSPLTNFPMEMKCT